MREIAAQESEEGRSRGKPYLCALRSRSIRMSSSDVSAARSAAVAEHIPLPRASPAPLRLTSAAAIVTRPHATRLRSSRRRLRFHPRGTLAWRSGGGGGGDEEEACGCGVGVRVASSQNFRNGMERDGMKWGFNSVYLI